MQQNMKIQVDTGSRLDKSGDTTFGFSNHIQRVLVLKQTVRDECLRKLSGRKLSKELRLFSACVYLLIKNNLKELEEVQIDEEYSKHGGDIKRHLANLIKRHSTNVEFKEKKIQVKAIGKKSRAHEVSWQTLRGKRRADGIVSPKEISGLLLR